MTILKLLFSKFHFPKRRFNSFFGNNTLSEFFKFLIMLVLPRSFFKSSIQTYEKNFGLVTGTKFNYSYALGRMALYQGLMAARLESGDEILLPAFTCVVVPNAIIYAGIKPIYVDIESTFFNFNLDDLNKKITPKTKALYLQYTFGHIGEIQKYVDFANKHNLIIIEDCAHLLGQKAVIDNKEIILGTLGLFSFYSTDHSKIISTHLGGMLCTNDKVLASRIDELNKRVPMISTKTESRIILNAIAEFVLMNPYLFWLGEFFMTVLQRLKLIFHFNNELITNMSEVRDYPVKLGPKLAEIGISQLQKLEKNLNSRKNLVKNLRSFLPIKDHTPNLALLRYSFLVKDRKVFTHNLNSRFQLGVWFTSIFQGRDDHFEEVQYISHSCPQAEYTAEHIVNFPTHQAMNLKIIKRSLEKISYEVI